MIEAQQHILIPFIPVWIIIGLLNLAAFLSSPKEKTE